MKSVFFEKMQLVRNGPLLFLSISYQSSTFAHIINSIKKYNEKVICFFIFIMYSGYCSH